MKEKFYFAKGVIRYKNDWIILECPHSIANYYRFWVERFIGKKTSTSYHGSHVTILPGKHERGINQHPLWGKYEGKVIEFKYFSDIKTDHEYFFLGEYFWLLVECPFIQHIRTELGLKPDLKWPLHLTVCYRGY